MIWKARTWQSRDVKVYADGVPMTEDFTVLEADDGANTLTMALSGGVPAQRSVHGADKPGRPVTYDRDGPDSNDVATVVVQYVNVRVVVVPSEAEQEKERHESDRLADVIRRRDARMVADAAGASA